MVGPRGGYWGRKTMSNVHHLRNVAQGAGRWNAWRKQEPGVQPDLAQADLRGANLSGLDLGEAILSLANLKKADLSGANLKDANLAGSNLDEVNMAGANLEGANIAGAYLLRANFSGCNLRRVNLAGAGLVGKVNLAGADLSGANLAGARLVGARLSGANLTRAILAGADLRDADLSGANFTDADTSGTRFDGADLSGTVLQSFRSRHREDTVHEDDDGQPYPADEEEAYSPEEAADQGGEPELSADQGSKFEITDAEAEFLAPHVVEPEPEPVPEPAPEAVVEEAPLEVAPPPPPPVLPLIAEDEGLFFSYETKNFAILSLHLSGLAEKTMDDRHDLLELLSRYNSHFLNSDTSVYMAAKSSAIIAAFESPTDALRCAERYLSVLRGLNVAAHVAINWGTATVRRGGDDGRDELIVNSVSPAARLEPLANPGEVVVLEEIRSHPGTNRDLFDFARVTRKWRRDVDRTSPGVDVVCYLVTTRTAQA